MLTGCRSAALAVLVGLLVVYARVLLVRPARGALLLLLGAALIWQFYLHLPHGLKARLRTAAAQPYTASAGDDLSGRLEVWPIAMRLFTDHPLMGIGAGAFTDENPEGIATHNVFLGVAAELGLIGLLLYLAAVWYAVRGPLAAGPGQWPCWAALALISVWLAIGLAGVWEVSPVAWYSFAWLSVIPAVHALPARASAHRRRRVVPVAARAPALAASLRPVVS
jgi:O-antigen ligase